MPIPIFPNLDGQDDPSKRSHFAGWVLGALNSLAEEEYRELFVDDLYDSMAAAWADAGAQFDWLPAAVAELRPDQVANHGLGGDQLSFKLATVRYWATRFLEAPLALRSRLLRRLLDAIDTLLESLLDALGVGSSLKEMKDAIRDSVRFIEDAP